MAPIARAGRRGRPWTLALILACLLASLAPRSLAAQNVRLAPAASAVMDTGWVTLRGNTRPEANAGNDRGRVSDDLPLDHLMLLLQRSAGQEQALQQFIRDLHDPTSPLFHHWITAAEFGRNYGVAPGDAARVTDWLESQGFKVNLAYSNQMVIDFTGSAGQIRQAFHTEIHNLQVNGKAHIANMSDPQIPAGLAPTIAGVISLNDFRPERMLRPRSEYTAGNGEYPVVPADLWTIYNFSPAFASGYSGQGQTIVVIEDTDLYSTADWNTFRSTFGLASAYPLGSLTQVHPSSTPTNNCTDPAVNADDDEAAVDVEWASAAAPSATIELASCLSAGTWGGFIALQNLLNASGTPPAIVSISYGESESELGAATNALINSLYQQAVTEGVSVFVSSGDAGAAISDIGSSIAQGGINISGFTSTPYNVSVGGTDFADTYERKNSTYWNSSNGATYGSAHSYVPEIPWNDSCASVLYGDFNRVLPTYGSSSLCDKGTDQTTVAGSGGPSGCAAGAPDVFGIVGGTCAGYLKPLWQSGFVGNPSDGVRDIPDVSLFAANGFWDHYYVYCLSDLNNGGMSCSGSPNTWSGSGGTSFSAPIMAGIQSLVNQASGDRWGNPNPAYYSLAATEYGASGNTSCNSALGNTVGTNCIFYDVTQIPLLYEGTGSGGDIALPCEGENCYAPSGTIGVLSTAPQTLTFLYSPYVGSGYTSAPSCTLSGGGGTGATCSSILTGLVSSVTLTNPGSGYVPTGTACTLTGGGGTGATCGAAITIPAGQTTGFIAYVFLTNRGSGYTSAPSCTVTGGGGTGATCTAAEQIGPVASLTAGGSGYTSLPHCVLSGGGGTGATCAVLAVNTSNAYQPAFTAGTGWDFATGIGTVNASNLVGGFLSSSATLSPGSLSFALQTPFTTSAPQSVTVTNTGTAKMTILAATVGGANPSDFAKSSDTCTGVAVNPNGTCKVSVTFTPTFVGNLSAVLNFTGIAPNASQTVPLSGIGSGAEASLSPTSLNFPNQITGTSAAQTVTLTNTGNISLTLSIAITGTNSGDFTQTNTCGSSVGAGANCAINVKFKPSALGNRSATLKITDNALNSPQTVALTGSSANPVPLINQPLVPTSVAPGGLGFTLTVNGTGFASDATVNWNGVALATTSVNSEKLTATVPAANIALAGTASISVVNPGTALISNALLFPITASVPWVTFANASGSPITAGNPPKSIVMGDFIGNGKLDLAVVNASSNNMIILMGNGDGTFTEQASSPATGTFPIAATTGDFNRDGKLDLAVANFDSNNVTILLGNGDGTFTPVASSPVTGSGPNSIATGDFNGDGKLDLAVVIQGTSQVAIFLGNGDGTFSSVATSPATGSDPVGIAVGDFNGDGKLDLAVLNVGGNNVTILLGNGDGTFTPAAASPATGHEPLGLALGDFNGDGKLDLAVTNYFDDTVTILLGNGDGTFTPVAAAPATGSAPVGLAVGDFNGDGKLDLAVGNEVSNTVTIMLGNGDGTFTPYAVSPPVGQSPNSCVLGDFNGDGRLDFATANIASNNVSVMLQLPPIPEAGVLPGSVTFSSQTVGTTSAAQPVTLTNTGNGALTIGGIVASANFGQTNTCGNSLAASASCTIYVTFSPTAAGPLTGTLTITDNNNGLAGSTQTVTLSGAVSVGLTWSETGGKEDMAVAVAAFVASGTPTLVGHAEAGNPYSATTAAINTTGATLLVAWTAEEGADPSALSDSYGNTWQALPVYSNGANSHGRLFYAYGPTVGPNHTFSLLPGGHYPALAVSAWSGTLSTAAVYQGSTGAVNASTLALATGALAFSGPTLLVTAWAADSSYYQGLAVNQGFNVIGSLTNPAVEEIASHAYLVSGAPGTLVSIAVTPANGSLTAGQTQQFTATGTYSDSSTQNLTSTVTWSSTNPAAATIASGGLATGVGPGSTTIQATSGALSGSTGLTVTSNAPPVPGPTWSETGGKEDMAVAVAAFVASGTPTLLGHAEAGNPYSATTAAINTTGATLLVAWTAEEGADPSALSDSYGNTWQALPVYSNGANSHGRLFYAYGPTVGPNHTFSLLPGGHYPALAVSAWSGTLSTAAVYQGSTGAVNASTLALATGALAFSGPTLLVTAWAADSSYYQGLAVNQGFNVIGSLTNPAVEEIASHAYLVSGAPGTLVSIAVTPANGSLTAGQTQQFTATGTYSDSSTQNLTSTVTWSSTNPAAATIASGGLATGVGPGSTTIQATSGALSGSTGLTVTSNAPPVPGPTWSETGGKEDMAVAVAAFVASGTPTLVGHAEAGNPYSATTAAINTTGATLLVAWTAEEGADPSALSDSYGNTWQALPVYSNGANSHGRLFYAYGPTVGPNHTFSLLPGGHYPALAVSAWSGTLSTAAVYQGSTGAVNASTLALATGALAFSGPTLLVTAWAADSSYYQGLAVNQGFNVIGSLTNPAVEEIASHAYLVSGAPGTLVSIAVTPANGSLTAGQTQQFTATGTYSDSSTQNLTSTVTWSSTNPAAATIASGGLATGVGPGSTTIQATSGALSGSTGLTVTSNAPPVPGPTWSETGGKEDMAVAVAAFVASGTPTLLGHAEAGNPYSATTAAINTTGATLLVAWTAEEGADPSALSDSYGNTWQALPVYSNGANSHGRLFYAYGPTVGPNHTFSLLPGGHYPALAVSAWSGTLSTAAVYQGSTGAVNASTLALATGALAFSGPTLLVTAWAADSSYYQGLAVNQGFNVIGSLTNPAVEEIASDAYLIRD